MVSSSQPRTGATAFEDRPVRLQALAVIAGPVVLGTAAGIAVAGSATVYWVLQAVALLGGLLGGMEHRSVSTAADRGLLGGLVFGSSLLLAHAIDGRAAAVSLGSMPGFLVVITGVFGAALASAGALARRRRG